MGHFGLKMFLALALVSSARAQFSQLAATDDGSRVYFGTSLRLNGENPLQGLAIYRIQDGAINRVTYPLGLPIGSYSLSQGNPQVSGDGRVFSYTVYQNCFGGSACIFHPSNQTSAVTVDGQSSSLGGEAQISRNGRFVLTYQTICCPIPVSPPPVTQLYDLLAGTTVPLPFPPASKRAVTSGGTALLLNSPAGPLTLWSSQSSRPLATAEPLASAILNDLDTWAVYEGAASSQVDLRALEISTGRDVLLATRSLADSAFGPSISDDAATVLYLAAPQPGQPAQAWTIRPDGTGRRQLTNLSQGVSEALITANGQSAIAVADGRLLSIDIATGAVRELITTTPTCSPGIFGAAPGTLFPLTGTALAASTEVASPPLPTKLAGAQVLMNGTPLPLLSVSPTQIWFQVPFETPVGTSATFTLSYGSPFNGCSVFLPISERHPAFVSDPSGHFVFIHQDFSGYVTDQSPARPGEVVVAYALALGGVTSPVATGVPTPSDQLYPLSSPFACYQAPAPQDGPPLEVPFAGLAPGMIGVYQVNVRMPDATPSASLLFLNCGTPGDPNQRTAAAIPIAAR